MYCGLMVRGRNEAIFTSKMFFIHVMEGPRHRSTTAQENSHFQKVLNMMPWLRSNAMQVRLSNHASPGPTNESKSQTVSLQQRWLLSFRDHDARFGSSIDEFRSNVASIRSIRCRGCHRRQIRVRLSYYGNQAFNEGSGRSSRSDSPQTWPPDGRLTRRKRGGWAHCVDATKHARTESKYCR